MTSGTPSALPQVLVVGEALVDVVTAYDGTTSARPGGSPANVAVGLGRLGHPVRLVTALGDDDAGRLVRAHLESSGVEVVAAATLPRTSTAVATLDEQGAASYAFDLEWSLPGDLDPGPADWLHVGSVAVTLEPGASVVRRLVRAWPGPVSYDVNCRPALMPSPAEVLGTVEGLLPHCDLVKLSDEDLAWLAPQHEATALAQSWVERGPRRVVVTLGPRGAVCWEPGGERTRSPGRHLDVVDTVGAGDSFMSGLVSSLVQGGSTDAALSLAVRAAAVTVQRAGADPPWAHELG